MADPPPYPGAPRWLWMFGAAVSIIALLLVVLIHVSGAPHHGMPSFGGPAVQDDSR
jgi:ABC-type phosphate transport system auxiliary subunit